MKIELRHRKYKSGNESLYLEFYEGKGKRTYESLNLFLIPERTAEDRRVNESTLKVAQKIKSERVLGIDRKEDDGKIEKKIPAKCLSDWMDSYHLLLQNDKAISVAHCHHMKTTINIVKCYLAYIHRPRLLLSKIDKSFVKNFLIYIKDVYRCKSRKDSRHLSEKTMYLVQNDFNTILNHAVKEGMMKKNPYFELKTKDKIHKTASEREFLTIDELNALADVYTGSLITKQTFMFCCFTGLRHSDMATLKWRDIKKTDNGEVIFLPSMQKTKRFVSVPLGEQAKRWMPERGIDEELVFPKAPAICNADRALKYMAKRAGINKVISFHCSRHTFATMNITAGADLYTTSKLLGHTNIHTTEIYADVTMKTKIDATNLLNMVF